jgi:hypothetical protein
MPANISGEPHRRTKVRHDDHIDFLEGGRLIHEESGRREEHRISVTAQNPARCDSAHRVVAQASHVHGPGCGHESVPHGDHVDYLVEGRLQHPHGDHVDDHGPLKLA